MLNADTVAAALWILLFAGTYWLALDFPPGPPGIPGPAYVPKLLVYTGAVLALLLLREGIKLRQGYIEWKVIGKERLLQTVTVIALVALYLLLWGQIPWVLLSFGFLMLVSLVLRLSWWVAALTSGILSVGLYLLFARGFYVML